MILSECLYEPMVINYGPVQLELICKTWLLPLPQGTLGTFCLESKSDYDSSLSPQRSLFLFSNVWFLVNCFLFSLVFRLFDKPSASQAQYPFNHQRLTDRCSDGEQKLSLVPGGLVTVGRPQGEVASVSWNLSVVCARLGHILPGTVLGVWLRRR